MNVESKSARNGARVRHERFCRVGDVELCFETFGDPGNPTLLLIMGLGMQMIGWHEDFCELLVERGFHVVRFDNRDCGRSTHFDDHAPPSTSELVLRRISSPPYTLEDMARDAAGLLDHLGVERAHIVGASLGGMIALTLTARSPQRVRTLVSIMSNTGSLRDGQADPRLLPLLLRRPAVGKAAYIERALTVFRRIGSPGYPPNEQDLRSLLELSFDRGVSDAGRERQLGAIFATGSRIEALRSIRAPTLVIHGTADRLIRPSGGRATARTIPGANLLLLQGMGHDLPRPLWPAIAGAIADHATP